MRKKGEKNAVSMLLVSFICIGLLFAENQNPILKLFQGEHIDMQEVYDNMSELIPVVVYLEPEYSSAVEHTVVSTLYDELKTQMITGSVFKPVVMDTWLASAYGERKATSIFQFISELQAERYPVNLLGVCKSYVYKVGNKYVIKISVYPFDRTGYPVSAMRIIQTEADISEAVSYLLYDAAALLKEQQTNAIRLAVEPFEIHCKTLVEQKTGEFDFIATSFSTQEGVEIKDSDDYFSELFSYQAQCTGLFCAATTQSIDEYIVHSAAESTAYASAADYVVRGDIILSNKFNVVTMDLLNARTGRMVKSAQYITESLSLQEILNSNYRFISDFCMEIYTEDEVKIIDRIDDAGRFFYMNGMLAGFDSIQHIPVRAGKTIIHTGTYLTSDVSLNPDNLTDTDNRDFFIYTNNDTVLIYKGREGAFVWNLLEK